MAKRSRERKSSPKKTTSPVVTVAWIGVISALITGIFAVGIKWIERLPAPTAPVIFTPTQISLETQGPTLTLIPAPTPWPLGNQTTTDPKPACKITVSDSPAPGREYAKALQFSISAENGYCSWIVPLHGYNASRKKQVTFWVKGMQGGEEFEIGLKDRTTIAGQEPKSRSRLPPPGLKYPFRWINSKI